MGVLCVLRLLNEELACATDKWLQVINTNKELKNKAVSSIYMPCYVVISNVLF